MKARVVKGFALTDGFTYPKGSTVDFDETLTSRLVELGRVRVLEDATKASKAKLGQNRRVKNNARKTSISR